MNKLLPIAIAIIFLSCEKNDLPEITISNIFLYGAWSTFWRELPDRGTPINY